MTSPTSVQLHDSWLQHLAWIFQTPQMNQLREFLREEQKNYTTFPPNHLIFNALNTTPLTSVRVVILGQDPYHGPRQANGLSFSVNQGITPPPSLQNIFQELQNDLGISPPPHGDLSAWAQRGVLLLNTVLTVRARNANSHREKGWEFFTDEVIKLVSREVSTVVFILWGKSAQAKRELINESKHWVIASPHPSPYSANRGFFGSSPFSKTNAHLVSRQLAPIDWQL